MLGAAKGSYIVNGVVGTVQKKSNCAIVFLNLVMLTALLGVIFASFSVADHASDGRGGAGIPGDSNETKLKYKDTPPADTSTPCVDESLLKKLDKPLQSIVIFDDMDEVFTGFYIRLREKDTSCEFKRILEQRNLKITYSPEKNLVYLAFTAENVIDEMNEVRNLPFVEYVYPDIVKVPAKSSEKLRIFINLNQNDNASQKLATVGGKNMSVYDQPGELGRILQERMVELHSYDTDLKSYYAEENSTIIRDVVTLSFVQYVELAAILREAGALEDYKPKSENITLENVTKLNKSQSDDHASQNESVQEQQKEEIVKMEENKTSETPSEQKTNWLLGLISRITAFFKSLFS